MAACAATVVATNVGVADANGRYPTAQFFALGEGAQRDRIAIVTTFGLVTSEDGGATWDWTCEEAVGFSGQYDPAVAITSDGTLVAGLPDGLSRTAQGNWCEWSRPSTFSFEPVVDLSAVGASVVASLTPPAATQFVSRSNDHGATWTRAWARAEFYAHTIDLAPSRVERVYTTGWVRGARPALFRSDDSGGTFVETTRDFAGGYAAYIAWVDPLDPDALLVRADLDPEGALLLRSGDGGATFRTLFRGTSSLVGVTAAPGGRTLWVSTNAAADRIRRSTDGGESWSAVASDLRPRSMRFRDGVLFATANEMNSGMSFACSRDGGDTFTPMLVLSRLRGPERCAATSVVRTRCAPLWDSVRAQLAMITRPPVGPIGTCTGATPDGGTSVPDASPDASGTDSAAPADARTDAGLLDGPATDAGERPRLVASGGCSCVVSGHPKGGSTGGWWLLVGLGALVHSDARRRFRSRSRGLR
ncbi:MAG: hypothetical protein JNK05_22745 [Myxococcales bacterium]|nr:hypothetical protein [Myxococcales bacterium]